MAKDRKSKKGQEEGGEEEVKVQPGKDSVNDDAGNAKQGGGKKAKKNRKKDDWEDDVAKELEALSLETKGGKKAQDDVEVESLPEKKQKEKTRGKATDPSNENVNEENLKGKQSKKQKGKKGKVEESDDESISAGKGGKKTNVVVSDDDEEEISIKDKKTKGKKANVHDSDEEDSVTQKKGRGKKKGKGLDSDDESIDIEKNQKTKKRGQKGKDVSDDEIDIVSDSKSSKRKGKKNREVLSDDEGPQDVKSSSSKQKKGKGVNFHEDAVAGEGTTKKSKGKKGKNVDTDDEQDEDLSKSKTTKSTKPSKPKSGFQLLEMDDMDVDEDLSDESPVEVKTKQKKQPDKSQFKADDEEMDAAAADASEIKKDAKGAKKSKKKERKRKDDDDEDVDKILEELAMEMEGKKPPEKPKEEPKEKSEEVGVIDDVKPSEVEEQSKKKKKKKKAADSEAVTSEKPADDVEPTGDAAGDESTVKSAAQKRKEKKEREKMKKLAQNEQERSKSTKGDTTKEDKAAAAEPKPPQEEEPQPMEEDKAEEDEADDKKKKKKKKKGEEEDKKDKKRPGKKTIAAMQEALKKVKEEEERLQREEEERQKAAEEAERLRQEKLRLEQERKEKKKQKEKEKRERLKAEGKLLNKSQRQARARMEATLQALRQQGVEVPLIGEKIGEKKPRLGDRKRTPRKKEEEKKEEVTPEVKVEIVVEPQKPEESEQQDNKELVAEEWDAENVVKDAWDETTTDEETDKDEAEQEEEEKPPAKPEKPAVVAPVKKQESVEESDETTESEESSSEEESESEEESSDDSEDDRTQEEKVRERALERIKKRREEAEKNRSVNKLRSPVVCVLGHVDTGKTKILDKIRRTHVQDSEAGGITQQIGATMVPQEALKEKCKMVKGFPDLELKVPGLLIIDTPGHESFSNLRSRGSSLCDIAVLVVDIMHGLEQQTIESINLLKAKKTPFIVALNKIDRLYEWKAGKNKDVQDVIKSQARNTKMEFDKRTKEVIVQFAEQGLNTTLYYENSDPRSWISMVPTSAHSGDGMGNLLALIVELTQTMMTKRIAFSEELQATVLEVKAIPGLGTTIDVILVNGRLREGDSIVLAGHDGAMATQIRALLMPQPLKELRVKNPYEEFKEVEGAQGVKIAGKDLDKAIAGLQLLVAHHPDEIEILKDEVNRSLQDAMNAIKLAERGVYVQASTLGSLEALLEFLKVSKVPYSGIRIGPVVKKDVMKASIMLEHDSQYAVILAFDVKIERDAQELADSLGVRIFQADIIYNLFDRFMEYREELKNKKREEFKNIAVFPCKLRILPQFVFNSRDPIVVGVVVEAGVVKDGTPLCVPSKEFLEIGTVSTIEINHKAINSARKGQEVCIKIEPNGGEAPKMFGRHFDHTDMLVSKISRQSIDACKEYFRDDLQKTDWQLMVELKKTFQIL